MPSKNRVVDLRGGRNVPPPSPRDVRPREPRRSTLRERKRKMRAVVTAAVSVCALLSIYSIHLASYMQRFTFQRVSVTGAHMVQPAQIETFIQAKLAESSHGFLSGRNIFIYNYGPLGAQIVQHFPPIKDAQVKRDTSLGNGLVVSIVERTPYAQWCDTSCFLLDDQGVIFAPAAGAASSSLPSQYVFAGELSTTTLVVTSPPYGEVFAGEHFAGIIDLLSTLRKQGLTPTGATLENATDFSISLAQGYDIKASFGEDADALAKNLLLILNADALKDKIADLEYIDLRFGNRVYYKFKSDTQQTASTPTASTSPTSVSSGSRH